MYIWKTLLKTTDNLSRTLKDHSISAAEGNCDAQKAMKAIAKDGNKNSFDLFWGLLNGEARLIEHISHNFPARESLQRSVNQEISRPIHLAKCRESITR